MTTRYRLDPSHSRFTVQAFATGMLSFLGHNPTFAVRDFTGEVEYDPDAPEAASVRVTAKARSLELTDKVSANDRNQIEQTMWGETLEAVKYPEVVFESTGFAAGALSGDERPVRLTGHTALHGTIRPQQIDGRLTLYSDGIRLAGEFMLSQAEFGLRPVVALGGTLRLKDALRVSFDVVGWKESV